MTYTTSLEDAVRGAHAVVLVTRWPQLERLPRLMNHASTGAVLIDGRRMISKTSVPVYDGIGLGA
ncbi:MAG: hypothetical protein HC923_01460 [Myxococcales bacterium]|nr:hypothetical protein [Myxococcales bacterium]